VNILEVTHYMPPHMGGIERVAQSLVEGLTRRGHVVRWIASATPARAGDEGALVRVAGLNVLEDRLGVPFPVWSPRAVATLAREIARADVVHVHDCLYMGSASAAALCKRYDKPLLLTQHVGYVPFGRALDLVQRTAYRTLGRAVLTAADRRVACSAHVPQYLASLGFRGAFTVIANAIDASRFRVADRAMRERAREAWGVAREAKVVLFVGRLVPKKAIDRVLAAQRVLAREGVTLVVVGDGPLASVIDGVPNVVHHAQVTPERMPELYALADAFVLPSRGEGLPLSVQEALMCGLPVVVSDDPAFTANLSGTEGVAFAADDAALIAAMREAIAVRRDAEAIAAEAQARWGGERFIDAYEAVLVGLHHAARAR
jgi:glycosyltransferase involved in cell wall biosynthesis